METLSTEQLQLKDYITVDVPARKHKRGRPTGDIILAISHSISERYTVIYKSEQIIAVVFRRLRIAIIGSYFQPNFEIEDLIGELVDALSKANPDYHIILLGNYNCRLDIPNEKQETLLSFLQDNSFTCWNNPEVMTYISHNERSTIDLLFTNIPKLFK